MTQIQKIIKIIQNSNYDRSDMRNDIALMKMEFPLNYNRWVRPICLPDINLEFTKSKPKNGTLCTVVGWGSLHEKGPDRKYKK